MKALFSSSSFSFYPFFFAVAFVQGSRLVQHQLCTIQVDREITASQITISFSKAREEEINLSDYRKYTAEQLFEIAFNRRLYRISRRPDPPYYSASCSSDETVYSLSNWSLGASVPVKRFGIEIAFRSLLIEVGNIYNQRMSILSFFKMIYQLSQGHNSSRESFFFCFVMF